MGILGKYERVGQDPLSHLSSFNHGDYISSLESYNYWMGKLDRYDKAMELTVSVENVDLMDKVELIKLKTTTEIVTELVEIPNKLSNDLDMVYAVESLFSAIGNAIVAVVKGILKAIAAIIGFIINIIKSIIDFIVGLFKGDSSGGGGSGGYSTIRHVSKEEIKSTLNEAEEVIKDVNKKLNEISGPEVEEFKSTTNTILHETMYEYPAVTWLLGTYGESGTKHSRRLYFENIKSLAKLFKENMSIAAIMSLPAVMPINTLELLLDDTGIPILVPKKTAIRMLKDKDLEKYKDLLRKYGGIVFYFKRVGADFIINVTKDSGKSTLEVYKIFLKAVERDFISAISLINELENLEKNMKKKNKNLKTIIETIRREENLDDNDVIHVTGITPTEVRYVLFKGLKRKLTIETPEGEKLEIDLDKKVLLEIYAEAIREDSTFEVLLSNMHRVTASLHTLYERINLKNLKIKRFIVTENHIKEIVEKSDLLMWENSSQAAAELIVLKSYITSFAKDIKKYLKGELRITNRLEQYKERLEQLVNSLEDLKKKQLLPEEEYRVVVRIVTALANTVKDSAVIIANRDMLVKEILEGVEDMLSAIIKFFEALVRKYSRLRNTGM